MSQPQFEMDQPHPSVGEQPRPVVIVAGPSGRMTLLWALSLVAAVVVTAWVVRRDDSMWLRAAMAQQGAGLGGSSVGARGIYAFTGQMTSRSYGLFMMDVDSGTVWCYELARSATGEPQLKLVASRSWIYDRYLEEFNVAEPTPGAVQQMVQEQRSLRAKQQAGDDANGN